MDAKGSEISGPFCVAALQSHPPPQGRTNGIWHWLVDRSDSRRLRDLSDPQQLGGDGQEAPLDHRGGAVASGRADPLSAAGTIVSLAQNLRLSFMCERG